MDITCIAMTHNRFGSVIDNWALHLTVGCQSQPPDHVILVDQSPDKNAQFINAKIVRKYGYQHFYCPSETMNKSRGLNIGIKLANTDYVMMTDIDWLFSPNFFKLLRERMSPERIVLATAGYLPQGYSCNDLWEWVVAECEKGEISRRLSPGCCQCVERDWAIKVHGYDERFPAQDGLDDDFRCRAQNDGLEQHWIEWHEAQAIHQWHERSPLKGIGSELFSGDAPVVANLKGWGEWKEPVLS